MLKWVCHHFTNANDLHGSTDTQSQNKTGKGGGPWKTPLAFLTKKGLKYLLLRKEKEFQKNYCYMRVKITENEDENIHQFTVEWVQPAGVKKYQHGYSKQEAIIRHSHS